MKVKPLHSIDIVMSIYNQERIIRTVLEGIVRCTTTPFNLILVFDGCTDATEHIALSYLETTKPLLLKEVRTATAANVYETRANNIGFKLSTEDYMITLQDDMLIREKGWEVRLTYPLRAYDDVFAVTARTALNMKYKEGSSEDFDYLDMASREFLTLKRNVFAIRSGINRGPVAFRTDIVKKLNYLDEAFAPAQFDEFDLVMRAREQYGMKSGAFHIDYSSPSAWGKTRQSATTMNTSASFRKNVRLLVEKHPALAQENGRSVEHRHITEKNIDYTVTDGYLYRKLRLLRSDIGHIRSAMGRKYALLQHWVGRHVVRRGRAT